MWCNGNGRPVVVGNFIVLSGGHFCVPDVRGSSVDGKFFADTSPPPAAAIVSGVSRVQQRARGRARLTATKNIFGANVSVVFIIHKSAVGRPFWSRFD